MQILFAAPFILAAGLVFTVLSLIPRARRWAIPIPTGILAALPCSLVVLLAETLAARLFCHTAWPAEWATYLYLTSGIVAGVAGGIAAGALARFATAVLPTPLLRLAVILAGWSSYFVVLLLLIFCVEQQFSLYKGIPSGWPYALAIGLELLLSFIAAFLVAGNGEQFRTERIHLPCGMPFRKRGSRRPAPLTPSAR